MSRGLISRNQKVNAQEGRISRCQCLRDQEVKAQGVEYSRDRMHKIGQCSSGRMPRVQCLRG